MNESRGQPPGGWHWVDETGKQQEITEEDLYVKLSAGELESYTLVWKPGWGRWLPAFRVASLAWALPAGHARRPVKPEPGGSEAPAPPLDLYPELKQEAEDGPSRASLLAGQVTPEPVRPELGTEWDIPTSVRDIVDQHFDWSAINQANAGADEVDDNEPTRMVRKTELGDPEGSGPSGPHGSQPSQPPPSVTQPSRPPPPPSYPGAMQPTPSQPPPVSVPPRNYQAPTTSQLQLPGATQRPPPPPIPPGMLSEAASAPAGMPPASSSSAPQPGSGEFTSAPASSRSVPSGASSRRGPLLGVAIALLGVAGGAYILKDQIAGVFSSKKAPALSVTAPVPSLPREPERPPLSCRLAEGPTKLTDWATSSAPFKAQSLPDQDQRLVLAFTQAPRYAVGLSIDMATLESKQVYQGYRKEPIFSVFPRTTPELEFLVYRHGRDLPSSMALGEGRQRVGRVGVDYVFQRDYENPTKIWTLPEKDVSLPAVISTEDQHVIVLRVGGPRGTLYTGQIDKQGKPRTSLTVLDMGDDVRGLPDLALTSRRAALVFARGDKGAERLSLASFEANALPTARTAWNDPTGGPGGSYREPRIHGSDDALFPFALSWTEGPLDKSVVRFMPLDEKLEPLHEPIDVSPDGAQSFWSIVHHQKGYVFLAYIREIDGKHQLWGASVHCK